MHFLPKEIERYSEHHTQDETSLLKELNRKTYAQVLNPRMLSGHLQGRLLSMFCRMVRPKHILEIGTFTGYAALCLAEGLAPGGELHTIEKNPELKHIIDDFFLRSGIAQQLHLHIGDAAQIISNLNKTFDLVFIDADKENYALYYDLVIDKVRQGGIIIADNVLWSGKVLEPLQEKDFDTKAIVAFNKKIQEDNRVFNLLLPVRDGLMVMQKL